MIWSRAVSDFFVVPVWFILRNRCHFKRMHWYSTAMFAIGYLPRWEFWHNFWVNLSIQTQNVREILIFARVLRAGVRASDKRTHKSSHYLALKCLNCQSLNEFSLNTYINVCCSGLFSISYTIHLCAPAISTHVMMEWMLIFHHTAFALNKSEWFVHFFPSLLL